MRRLLILFFMLWLPLAALALMPDPLGARNGLRSRGNGVPDEEDLFDVRDRKRFLTDRWPEPSDILDSLTAHDVSDIPMEDIRDQLEQEDITDRIQTQDVSHIPMRDVTEAYRARMLERGAPRRLVDGQDVATWWATWGGTDDDRIEAMITQADGTLALAGSTASFGAGGLDALLLQVSPQGGLVQAKVWGGTGSDIIRAVIEQSDGTLALAGSTRSFGAGLEDVLLLQVYPSGDLLQAIVLGGSSSEYIHAMIEQSDGTLALAGYITGINVGNQLDAWYLRVATNGEVIHAQVWGRGMEGNSEWILALTEQSDGTLALAGATESFGAGSYDALLLQVDPSGRLQRAVVWGGTDDDRIEAMITQADGTLALAGSTSSFGASSTDALLLRVSLEGDLAQAWVFGSTSSDLIAAMVERGDGTLAMAGYVEGFGTSSWGLLLQVDSSDNLVQMLAWGGATDDDRISAMIEQDDGTLAMAGYTSSFGAGGKDAFILSLDREGQLSLSAGSALQQVNITDGLLATNVSSTPLVPWTTIQEQNITSSIQSQNITDLITVNDTLPITAYQVRDRVLPEGDVATWWASWGGTGEEEIATAIQQSDGNLALSGYTTSFGAGGKDVLLLQLSPEGNLVQARIWGGSSGEQIEALIEQSDGTLALVGYTESFGAGNRDGLLLQVDASGNLVQASVWGGSNWDDFYALVEQSDGTLALAGHTTSFGAGSNDALLLQVEANGRLVRAKVWGGSSTEEIYAMIEQRDGTLALAGETESVGAGFEDALLLLVDANGNLVQAKVWGGSIDDRIRALVEQSDGTLALAGETWSFGGVDALLLQVGPNGNLVQAIVWGGTGIDRISAMIGQRDGTLAMAGPTSSFGAGMSDALLLQVGPNGNLVQALVWGGSNGEAIWAMVEQGDGALVLAGQTDSFGAVGEDAFILSLDRNGQLSLPVGSLLQQFDITASLTMTNASSTPLVPWTTIQEQNITTSIQSENITDSLVITSPPYNAYQLNDFAIVPSLSPSPSVSPSTSVSTSVSSSSSPSASSSSSASSSPSRSSSSSFSSSSSPSGSSSSSASRLFSPRFSSASSASESAWVSPSPWLTPTPHPSTGHSGSASTRAQAVIAPLVHLGAPISIDVTRSFVGLPRGTQFEPVASLPNWLSLRPTGQLTGQVPYDSELINTMPALFIRARQSGEAFEFKVLLPISSRLAVRFPVELLSVAPQKPTVLSLWEIQQSGQESVQVDLHGPVLNLISPVTDGLQVTIQSNHSRLEGTLSALNAWSQQLVYKPSSSDEQALLIQVSDGLHPPQNHTVRFLPSQGAIKEVTSEGTTPVDQTLPISVFEEFLGAREDIRFSVSLARGGPLPSWFEFIEETLVVRANPPAGTHGRYIVQLTGTSRAGRSLSLNSVFNFNEAQAVVTPWYLQVSPPTWVTAFLCTCYLVLLNVVLCRRRRDIRQSQALLQAVRQQLAPILHQLAPMRQAISLSALEEAFEQQLNQPQHWVRADRFYQGLLTQPSLADKQGKALLLQQCYGLIHQLTLYQQGHEPDEHYQSWCWQLQWLLGLLLWHHSSQGQPIDRWLHKQLNSMLKTLTKQAPSDQPEHWQLQYMLMLSYGLLDTQPASCRLLLNNLFSIKAPVTMGKRLRRWGQQRPRKALLSLWGSLERLRVGENNAALLDECLPEQTPRQSQKESALMSFARLQGIEQIIQRGELTEAQISLVQERITQLRDARVEPGIKRQAERCLQALQARETGEEVEHAAAMGI